MLKSGKSGFSWSTEVQMILDVIFEGISVAVGSACVCINNQLGGINTLNMKRNQLDTISDKHDTRKKS